MQSRLSSVELSNNFPNFNYSIKEIVSQKVQTLCDKKTIEENCRKHCRNHCALIVIFSLIRSIPAPTERSFLTMVS